jgi:hypothetical protein
MRNGTLQGETTGMIGRILSMSRVETTFGSFDQQANSVIIALWLVPQVGDNLDWGVRKITTRSVSKVHVDWEFPR